MGNYYGGDLYLKLDPSKIKIDNLINILSREENNAESGLWYKIYPNFSLNKLRINSMELYEYRMDRLLDREPADPNDLYDLLMHDSYMLDEITDSDKELIEAKWEFLFSLDLEITVNSKYYNALGIEKIILNIIEILKPYKFKEDTECLGEIKDEDQIYKRDFYWNKEDLDNKIKERKYLCGNCEDNAYEDHLCDYYDLCKRAYDIAVKNLTN